MICAIERVRGNINNTVLKDIHDKDLEEVWKVYKNILDPVFNTVYQCLIHSYKSFPITGDISTSFYN
jgi:hypothetical protein